MRAVYGEIEFEYEILNPGGNKTAIVTGAQYNKEVKKKINDYILQMYEDVEQVGFINTNRLEMAGGEFCVNATRCAIWTLLKGKPGDITLNVSGYKEKIKGGIKESKDVYVNLNINKTLNQMLEKRGIYNLVKLDGILLAVVSEEDSKEYIKELKEDEKKLKMKLKETMKSFETLKKAVGIILLEEQNEEIKINPIIWVKEVDTLYYETACGSGSLATAIYKNTIQKREILKIIQPSNYSIYIKLVQEKEFIKNAIVIGKVEEE